MRTVLFCRAGYRNPSHLSDTMRCTKSTWAIVEPRHTLVSALLTHDRSRTKRTQWATHGHTHETLQRRPLLTMFVLLRPMVFASVRVSLTAAHRRIAPITVEPVFRLQRHVYPLVHQLRFSARPNARTDKASQYFMSVARSAFLHL